MVGYMGIPADTLRKKGTILSAVLQTQNAQNDV